MDFEMQEQEIKVNLCPDKCKCTHRCFKVKVDVSQDYTIMTEDIYLYKNNFCNEDTIEDALIHESIHTILYHFLDEEKFQNMLPKLINKNRP
jgi:hypothetical protein